MVLGWDELTALTGDRECRVKSVRIIDTGVVIEGDFELPPLGQLSFEDQVFIAMFVRAHGSIKEMGEIFGISYPTVKARLNKIADRLDFVDISAIVPRDTVLDQLEKGEISVSEAAERIKQQ